MGLCSSGPLWIVPKKSSFFCTFIYEKRTLKYICDLTQSSRSFLQKLLLILLIFGIRWYAMNVTSKLLKQSKIIQNWKSQSVWFFKIKLYNMSGKWEVKKVCSLMYTIKTFFIYVLFLRKFWLRYIIPNLECPTFVYDDFRRNNKCLLHFFLLYLVYCVAYSNLVWG